jgi:hypothetical protein
MGAHISLSFRSILVLSLSHENIVSFIYHPVIFSHKTLSLQKCAQFPRVYARFVCELSSIDRRLEAKVEGSEGCRSILGLKPS